MTLNKSGTNQSPTGEKGRGVLLVMPSGRRAVSFTQSWGLKPQEYGTFPPLGLLYLAASLRQKGYSRIRVVDGSSLGTRPDEIGRIAAEFQPALTGVTTFTVSFGEALQIAEAVKSASPGSHVCFGGPHVKTFPAQTLKKQCVDSIVIGDGEAAFADLADHLFLSAPRPENVYFRDNPAAGEFSSRRVSDLDALPFPARDLVAGVTYRSAVGSRPRCMTVVTTRGCPFRCTFCDVPCKELRLRSVPNVIEEIRQHQPGADTEIFFFDDIFNVNEKRFAEFCDALGKNFTNHWSFRGRVGNLDAEALANARRAGCRQMHIGVETCDDENLRSLKKDITMEQVRATVHAARKARVRVIADLMILMPFERSEADVRENVRKAVQLNPHLLQINILQLIPGTEIFEQAAAKGITSWREWLDYVENPEADFTPKTWNEYIPQSQSGRIWRRAYRMFYFRPRKIIELLFDTRSPAEFLQRLLNALKLIYKPG